MQSLISFALIVRNEEAKLPACLESIAGIADEIIVVDTDSTDRTKEVAASFGAKVFDFIWVDDFAAARNESIRHARSNWIFWLDADEYLDGPNRAKLQELVCQLNDHLKAFVMTQYSPPPASPLGIRVPQVRLFRNHPCIRWEYRVHEQIYPSLRQAGHQLRWTDIVINHSGYQDIGARRLKSERNVRLLQLDLGERPNDPFVLFNLGQAYVDLGRFAEAVTLLQRSIDRSRPEDSFFATTWLSIVRCYSKMGRPAQALSACRTGRLQCPDDLRLLYLEGLLRRHEGDAHGAQVCWRQLLSDHSRTQPVDGETVLGSAVIANDAEESPSSAHSDLSRTNWQFTDIDPGIGVAARHQLALLAQEEGHTSEAETQWHLALREERSFWQAWLGLGELNLAQKCWSKLDEAVARLETNPDTRLLGLLLRARGHLARKEFAKSRQILEETIALAPLALEPYVFLSHCLLQEGKDWTRAQGTLLKILELDPANEEAQHNLQVLRNKQKSQLVTAVTLDQTSPFNDGSGRAQMQAPVSFALIVRNEEAKLPTCLGSIAGIADEIIVVDTGSTDRTKELAAGFGAKVFDFAWIDDFAAARNECIRHATGEWIFWMDADERIDEVNREKLRRLFDSLPAVGPASRAGLEVRLGSPDLPRAEGDNVAYVMKCLCVEPSGNQHAVANGRHGTVVDHVRLFRNRPENRWKYRVHEQILPALKTTGTEIRWTDIVIHHVGYQDPALTRHKLERNLRLLHLDHAEHPDDPYILFNLGWAYQELGKVGEALSFLHRSLQLSHPADSIVKKIYALLVQAHWRLGQRNDALAACRAGRARYPADAELLYLEGQLLKDVGQVDGAIAAFRRLVSKNEFNHREHEEHGELAVVNEENYPRINTNRHEESSQASSLITQHSALSTPQFGSIEVGFTGYLARNQLAHLYYGKGMRAEAEAEWRQAVEERPDFLPAWLGLGELYLDQGRLEELDAVVKQVLEPSEGREPPEVEKNEGLVLKARGLLARKDYEPARAILEELGARNPRWVYPRVILSHVLLQEGKDLAAAEHVLREILDLDPTQVEAWRNLAVLFRHQGKLAQAAGACRSGRVHCPQDVDLLLLQGILLRENSDFPEAESCLLEVVSGQWPMPTKKAQECRVEARHQLALLYVVTGRLLEAEAQWREALAECPNHPAARQGLLDIRNQRGLKKQEVAGVT